MEINIIVAMSNNRAIGKNNQLLWHLPDDLKHFKKLTSGNPIIMGHKTYQSIGRPLPNRTNIIVSRNKKLTISNCLVANSIKDALELTMNSNKIFIIGGAEIYKLFLNTANHIYLTLVEADISADTYFPQINLDEWKETHSTFHSKDERHKFAFYFKIFTKNKRE